MRLQRYNLLANALGWYVILERSQLPADWEKRLISTHRDLNAAYRAKHHLENRDYRAATDYEAQDRIG